MRPITLPLVSDFKKEYKFLWYIQGVQTIPAKLTLNGDGSAAAMYTASLGNIIYCGYVSQLAENINLPDDEFETESVRVGPVDYTMPKKVKLADITVTYLEDSLNSVYNFHKAWFNAIRGGTGMNINSPMQLYATARYVEFENTMLAAEYILLKNQLVQMVNSNVSSYLPTLDLSSKPMAITTYPGIYPTKISRTAANKAGTGLAKVTVTYARIPQIKGATGNALYDKRNLQYLNGVKWENVSESSAIVFNVKV